MFKASLNHCQTIPRNLSPHRIRWIAGQQYRSAANVALNTGRGLFRARIVMALSTIGTGAAVYFLLPNTPRAASTSDDTPLSSARFTRATLTSSKPCGPDTKQLTLTIPPHLLLPRDPSTFAPIWSVFIKDDDIQVERPYTPLEGVDDQGRIRLWIKRYPKGEVGRWLHSRKVGDQIELRGPLKTWPWQEGIWDEVVMISGGTGITPFYQLFHTIISNASISTFSDTRFTLLHSSRTPADLPPHAILQPLTSFAVENPERFRLHLFVDSQDGSPNPTSHTSNFQVGRIGKTAIERSLGLDKPRNSWWQKLFGLPDYQNPKSRNILFLVCGPAPMVDAISGPYGRNFFQGSVGGVLGEMGLTSNQVRKL